MTKHSQVDPAYVAGQIAQEYLASLQAHILYHKEFTHVKEDNTSYRVFFPRIDQSPKGDAIIIVDKTTFKPRWHAQD